MNTTRIRIGDTVSWEGGPNEFRNNRSGKVISIHKGIAKIDDWRADGKYRLVPVKILTKNE